MVGDFHAYLDNFCNTRQLSWQNQSDPSQATLIVDGFSINIAYMEERGILFIQAGVGIPPEGTEKREAFWKRLLVANNGFSQTSGATLGYDQEIDMVTLQVSWPLAGLAQDSFENLIENTIYLMAQWLQSLAQMDTGANEVGTVDVPPMHDFTMLRV